MKKGVSPRSLAAETQEGKQRKCLAGNSMLHFSQKPVSLLPRNSFSSVFLNCQGHCPSPQKIRSQSKFSFQAVLIQLHYSAAVSC